VNVPHTVKLKVKEGLTEDLRKGIVRINREDMEILGADTGTVVLIQGEKCTAAKVYPSFNDIYGSPFIQMEGGIRRNAGVGIDDNVILSKADIKPATTIMLSPLDQFFLPKKTDMKEIKNILKGIPIISDDELSVILFGHHEIEFRVGGSAPAGVVKIDEGTKIVVIEGEGGNAGSRITYEDIGGLTKEVKKIRESIELPFKFPDIFQQMGFEPPKGILLYGPPGTGKTLIAKAIASETKAHFIHVNGPEIMNKFYGESEAKIREIFKEAKSKAPSIIFLDEIDSIAPRRDYVHGDVEKRVVAQLLALMDGLESRGQVVVIGDTNMRDLLDPALRRAGRFDKEIAIMPPDKAGRFKILQIHTKGMKLNKDVDLNYLADITYGFVGSDIAALCKEAGMVALRVVLSNIGPDEPIPVFEISMDNFIQAMREIEPSSTREYCTDTPTARWEDIGGFESIKNVLRILFEEPLHHPNLCNEYNITLPKGVLLTGTSGSGKTLFAKAVGNFTKANFITVNGLTLTSQWTGRAEKILHDIFIKAKQCAPCIIFFDEIDRVCCHYFDGGKEVINSCIGQLINEFDNFENTMGVTVLAATSKIELIPADLLREGRFEYVIHIPLPDLKAREAILKIHAGKLPIASTMDFKKLAVETAGMNGAELAKICHQAAFIALKKTVETGTKTKIEYPIFAQAVAQVVDEKKRRR